MQLGAAVLTFIRSQACVFKNRTSEQPRSRADCLKLSPVSRCRLSSQTRSCNPSLVIEAVPLKISFSFFLDWGWGWCSASVELLRLLWKVSFGEKCSWRIQGCNWWLWCESYEEPKVIPCDTLSQSFTPHYFEVWTLALRQIPNVLYYLFIYIWKFSGVSRKTCTEAK